MTPFDSHFLSELKKVFALSREGFRNEILCSESYDRVQWICGYAQAIDDIEVRGEEIERVLNGGSINE